MSELIENLLFFVENAFLICYKSSNYAVVPGYIVLQNTFFIGFVALLLREDGANLWTKCEAKKALNLKQDQRRLL